MQDRKLYPNEKSKELSVYHGLIIKKLASLFHILYFKQGRSIPTSPTNNKRVESNRPLKRSTAFSLQKIGVWIPNY